MNIYQIFFWKGGHVEDDVVSTERILDNIERNFCDGRRYSRAFVK